MSRPASLASLLAPTILVGCAGVAAIDTGRLLQAYVDCNGAASRRQAVSSGDPLDLAAAAEVSCGDRRAALERAYRRTVGEAEARRLIASVKSAAFATNATTIIMARGG
mgnify:CR=1 FL=1